MPLLAWLSSIAACAGAARGEPSPIAWQLPGGPSETPIWPAAAPGGMDLLGPENETTVIRDAPVAGRPWLRVRNVSRPTLTVYPPRGVSRGAAVIVFPGGGYHVLAIDLEGTEACDWLTSRGITCVVSKYRVPGERDGGDNWVEAWGDAQASPMALQDAQRTIRLVRSRAAELHVDPAKIGVLGFSAGGHLVAAVSTHFHDRTYEAVDGADGQSSRPDFSLVLYPGHLSNTPEVWKLNPDIRVTSDAPPTFLVQAEDDPVDRIENSLVYYAALRKAGVPAELHVFPQGGHAFGLRFRADAPITGWPGLAEAWLRTLRI